jgi:hypothetical protein
VSFSEDRFWQVVQRGILGIVGVVVLLFVLLFLVMLGPGLSALLIGYEIVTGVVRYPAMVFSRIHANPEAIGIGLGALAATTWGFHSAARWLQSSKPGRPPWQARWTAAGMALLVLTFAVAVDVAAVVHQTVWIFRSPPKSVVYDARRDTPHYQLGNLCTLARSPDGPAIGDRAARLASTIRLDRRTNDEWEIEIVRTPDGRPGGVVARPRDPRHPFAGQVFTCDGMVGEARAAEYVAEIESRVGAR